MTDIHTEHLQIDMNNWLDSEAAEAVLNGKRVSNRSTCNIAGKNWHKAIYTDFSGARNFVVFEIWREKLFGSEHHSLAYEILDGTYTPLSQEDLWKEGIP